MLDFPTCDGPRTTSFREPCGSMVDGPLLPRFRPKRGLKPLRENSESLRSLIFSIKRSGMAFLEIDMKMNKWHS